MVRQLSTAVDIHLDASDSTYRTGAAVRGHVVVTVNPYDAPFAHNGITLQAVGSVQLALGDSSVGILEALFSSIKPVPLLDHNLALAPAGRLPEGITRIPFEFPLTSASSSSPLFDTFHGANIQIMYAVSAEVVRPVLRGGSLSTGLCEFLVETAVDVDGSRAVSGAAPLHFEISGEGQEFGSGGGTLHAQGLDIRGCLDKSACFIEQPLTGHITVEKCPARVLSIDLELCRIEGCTTAEGSNVSETSVVQRTQVADGNASLGLEIPIHVVLPRLYCCPSIQARTFSVSFLVRVMVVFASSVPGAANPVAVRTLPIRLVRGDLTE
uniref:Uncharacterized protein n=1 Tax=Mantoniella antarctica TaxID=81844 RepID=A0A7S0SS58_9CHLO|mmetsp:Transcript_33671/g.84743  ORF Transcript_33671/g.84743 Transcript_33671/m.84743 type:complete len:325 (+) Transcript_33671:314-1288(+)|eukprot:CAMPEP_0181364692 /NCGR_PEP_ID=MMETSP1106-20121128/9570_1 /TAXON_ID=81844 /ORGANISM="Mantoniella antarctica, Strain SL-175" /LENGTH=324 /DNA_ID=CAMNT_0023479519 /DNA_START=170 /DNA_END=1144 /DNA_ORIENTATION=-